MAQPLLAIYPLDEPIDFTKQRSGRTCNSLGDKVGLCPHCKRRGMRTLLLSGKIRFTHLGIKRSEGYRVLDACIMYPRTEFTLQYGYDGIHPKFRIPGDEDETVEEIRQ